MPSVAAIVVGYGRVSTEGQAEEGVSLDAQVARIEGWCRAKGLPFDRANMHVDAGLSGKRSDNRPALLAALEAACRRGGILVVYSLSRLARSTRDTIEIADRLAKAGADLVSLTEDIDTTSAVGKMFFRILAVLAEFERDLTSERTKTALHHKRSKGERIGQVPYGHDLAGDGTTLVENPAEQEGLTLIRQMMKLRMPARKIAANLNHEKAPTKSGRPWSESTVRGILKRMGTDGQA